MVIAAVDHGYVDRQVREPFRRVEAGKAAADDDDAWTVSRGLRFCGLSRSVNSLT